MLETLDTRSDKEFMLDLLDLPKTATEDQIKAEITAVFLAHKEISIARKNSQPIEMIGWRQKLSDMNQLDSIVFWNLVIRYNNANFGLEL